MFPTQQARPVIGDCEAGGCTKTNTEVWVRHGNMLLCDDCWQKELKIIRENTEASRVSREQDKLNRSNEFIAKARQVDKDAHVKSDIFNLETVAIIQLQGAIQNDEAIPDAEKRVVLCEQVSARIADFDKLIFSKTEELQELQAKRLADYTSLKEFAVGLRTEQIQKLGLDNINYTPQAPKSPKPVKIDKGPKVSRKTYDKAAVAKYAEQYGVPADAIQYLVTATNMSHEDAAKKLKAGQDAALELNAKLAAKVN